MAITDPTAPNCSFYAPLCHLVTPLPSVESVRCDGGEMVVTLSIDPERAQPDVTASGKCATLRPILCFSSCDNGNPDESGVKELDIHKSSKTVYHPLAELPRPFR